MKQIFNDNSFNYLVNFDPKEVKNAKSCDESLQRITQFVTDTLIPASGKLSDKEKQEKGIPVLNQLKRIQRTFNEAGHPEALKEAIELLEKRIGPSLVTSKKLSPEEQFVQKFAALDRQSPTFAAKVKELLASPLASETIKKALNLLLDPQAYKTLPLEEKLLASFKEPLLLRDMQSKYNPLTVKSIADQQKSSLLSFMKGKMRQGISASFEKELNDKLLKLSDEALKKRIETLVLLPTASGPQTVAIENLYSWTKSGQKIEEAITLHLSEKAKTIRESYDNKSQNKFSEALRPYSFAIEGNFVMILDASRDLLIKQMVEEKFSLDSITPLKEGELLNTVKAAVMAQIRGTFFDSYEWLYNNLNYIVTSYDQGLDPSRNQGTGTCLQSSLERYALLLSNPEISDLKIPLGSSQKGRYAQSHLRHEPYGDFAAPFGLAYPQMVILSQNGKTQLGEQIVKQITTGYKDEIARRGGHFIFATHFSDKPGHAINIQYDPQKRIFRILDDDYGILRYPTESLFRERLIEHINMMCEGSFQNEIWFLNKKA